MAQRTGRRLPRPLGVLLGDRDARPGPFRPGAYGDMMRGTRNAFTSEHNTVHLRRLATEQQLEAQRDPAMAHYYNDMAAFYLDKAYFLEDIYTLEDAIPNARGATRDQYQTQLGQLREQLERHERVRPERDNYEPMTVRPSQSGALGGEIGDLTRQPAMQTTARFDNIEVADDGSFYQNDARYGTFYVNDSGQFRISGGNVHGSTGWMSLEDLGALTDSSPHDIKDTLPFAMAQQLSGEQPQPQVAADAQTREAQLADAQVRLANLRERLEGIQARIDGLRPEAGVSPQTVTIAAASPDLSIPNTVHIMDDTGRVTLGTDGTVSVAGAESVSLADAGSLGLEPATIAALEDAAGVDPGYIYENYQTASASPADTFHANTAAVTLDTRDPAQIAAMSPEQRQTNIMILDTLSGPMADEIKASMPDYDSSKTLGENVMTFAEARGVDVHRMMADTSLSMVDVVGRVNNEITLANNEGAAGQTFAENTQTSNATFTATV